MIGLHQPKTIAVDLTNIHPGGENGGAKIFALELLRSMAAISPQTKFVLLTQHNTHDELSSLDRPNMRRLLMMRPSKHFLFIKQLKNYAKTLISYMPEGMLPKIGPLLYKMNRLLKRQQSQKTILDQIGANLLFCPLAAPTYAQANIPTVCTLHDLQYKSYPQFFRMDELIHRDQSFAETYRRATMLVAVSNYTRDTAIRHGAVDPARIRTIYTRMAQRIMNRDHSDLAPLLKLKLQAQRYFIYPANFWKHKNHEMLMTAFNMACNEGLESDIKLVCTGNPGPRHHYLKESARTMHLEDRILFPGFVSDPELAVLMTNSLGLLFPSLYEGFGLPVIEAMAAGVPVACSNFRSLPEIADHAALFFDPREPAEIVKAIHSLATDESTRSKLIAAGKLRAAEFSDTQKMAKEYLELFQRIV